MKMFYTVCIYQDRLLDGEGLDPDPKEAVHMTGKERIQRILKHQPVDRIGLYEHFWNDTYKAWEQAGHLKNGSPMRIILDLTCRSSGRSIWRQTWILDLRW